MTDKLEQLKKLVLSGGFDAESKKQVLDIENQLHELAVKERLAEHPVIQEYIAFLQAEYDRADTLLRTNRKLTDLDRAGLFARIDLTDRFLRIFNGKEREHIEAKINDLLHVARTT